MFNNNLFIKRDIKPLTAYENIEKSNLVNIKNKKMYDYYICDYCGEEIIIKKKNHEMDGGIVEIPKTFFKNNRSLKLVLHNKCLNKAIKELEVL